MRCNLSLKYASLAQTGEVPYILLHFYRRFSTAVRTRSLSWPEQFRTDDKSLAVIARCPLIRRA